MFLACLVGGSLALLPATVASAQPVKWECKFAAAATYHGGRETTLRPDRYAVRPEPMDVTFLETESSAYIVGNAGAEKVAVYRTDLGSVQFLERTQAGIIHLAVIDRHGNAVYSRSSVAFDGTLLASQYYGQCRAL